MTNQAKVGIFATATVAVFILGFYFLKGTNLFERKNVYYAIYPRIDGLYKSNLIEVNGYPVGKVGELEYNPENRTVRVRLDMQTGFKIPRRSTTDSTVATLVSVDFFGTKKIDLKLGDTTAYYDEGDTISANFKTDLMEKVGSQIDPIMGQVKSITPKIDSVLSNIKWLTNPDNPNGIMGSKAQIDATVANLNKLILANSQALTLTIKHLESITGNIEKNNGSVEVIVKNARSVTDSIQQANLKQTIENLNATVTQLKTLLTGVNEGKGSLGKLVKQDGLYNNIDSTIASLNVLMKDIKARPYRYININVLGSKKRDERNEKKFNESGK